MNWYLWIAYLSLSREISCAGPAGNGQVESQAVVGRVGESVILGCDLLNAEEARSHLYVIEWVRFGFLLPIFIKFGLYSPRIDPEFVGRVRIQEGASLRIDLLRAEDQGWYECRVLFLDRHNNDDEFQNGTWTHLTVNSAPTFLGTPPALIEVPEKEPLSLTCSAIGSPQPVIVWKRNDLAIESGDKVQVSNGTLRITSVERASAGIYTCHASSKEGSVTHATRLLVQGPPVIVVPPQNITVNITQDAFLACQAEAYPGNLTYSWFQGSSNVYHLSHLQSRVRVLVDGSLLLQKTTPDDAGKYTCVPSNGLRKPPSASAFITVLYPAQVTTMPPETLLPKGMQGMIQCPTKANPPLLSISWTKDGHPLELDKFPGWSMAPDGSIVIATGNDDALGLYTCTPYNSYGTAGASAPTRVLLKDPPMFAMRPKEEYFQEVGRELVIPCTAQGDPPPMPPMPAPGMSGILQYLSLPFFKEMSVDGDWPPQEEPCELQTLGSTEPTRLGEEGPTQSYLGPSSDPLLAKDQSNWALSLPEQPLSGPPAEKLLRSSLTSQSSGRGSVSFLRPPSLALSLGGTYLSSPLGETAGWQSEGESRGSMAEEGMPRKELAVATVSKRRNTSVDENYEWDSEFALESDILDALQLYRTLEQPPGEPSEGVSGSPQALASPEARCMALREEFLAYRRRREVAKQRRQRMSRHGYDERFEQATLL
uniref:Immunoglobulin superfamily member 9 n=1 Tax=Chelonoidis abingdonii TaxID=106734 RepID=A0A8C0J3G2_CHEAB